MTAGFDLKPVMIVRRVVTFPPELLVLAALTSSLVCLLSLSGSLAKVPPLRRLPPKLRELDVDFVRMASHFLYCPRRGTWRRVRMSTASTRSSARRSAMPAVLATRSVPRRCSRAAAIWKGPTRTGGRRCTTRPRQARPRWSACSYSTGPTPAPLTLRATPRCTCPRGLGRMSRCGRSWSRPG